MRKTIMEAQKEFESSCGRTPEYLAWHRLFKREFGTLLKEHGAIEIQIGSPNHFDVSGFFRMSDGQAWWFRIEDLRWSKSQMLIRKAKDFKDYTGMMNQYASFTDAERFIAGFDRITESRVVA